MEGRIQDIAIIHYVTDARFIDGYALRHWLELAKAVYVVSPALPEEVLPEGVQLVQYEADRTKTAVWNELMTEVDTAYILFLEDDERFDSYHMPDLDQMDARSFFPVRIQTADRGERQIYYQLRFLPNLQGRAKGDVFDGAAIADATRSVYELKLEMRDFVLPIRRTTPLYRAATVEEEFAAMKTPMQAYLVMGKRYFDDGRFVEAASSYRSLLKREHVLPFDRLAAINGLAGCMAEQHRWPQALDLARQSIEAEPQQYLPYLIQFRIHQLAKNWKHALNALEDFKSLAGWPTRAGFEVGMASETLLLQLADMAFKAGLREEAFRYYEQIFHFRQGAVEQDHIKLLFVFAMELANFEKACYYFEVLYGQLIPDGLDEESRADVMDSLQMFMKKEWYDYATDHYIKLFESDPANPDYRRALIAGLSKTKRLNEAKAIFRGLSVLGDI